MRVFRVLALSGAIALAVSNPALAQYGDGLSESDRRVFESCGYQVSSFNEDCTPISLSTSDSDSCGNVYSVYPNGRMVVVHEWDNDCSEASQ